MSPLEFRCKLRYLSGFQVDADFVADCRFLPNPFWVPELRQLSGQDDEVVEYVLGQPAATPFLDSLQQTLEIALEGYRTENKRYATIALGCTGGKHRSVTLARELAARLRDDAPPDSGDLVITVVHRDLGRE